MKILAIMGLALTLSACGETPDEPRKECVETIKRIQRVLGRGTDYQQVIDHCNRYAMRCMEPLTLVQEQQWLKSPQLKCRLKESS